MRENNKLTKKQIDSFFKSEAYNCGWCLNYCQRGLKEAKTVHLRNFWTKELKKVLEWKKKLNKKGINVNHVDSMVLE